MNSIPGIDALADPLATLLGSLPMEEGGRNRVVPYWMRQRITASVSSEHQNWGT